MDYISYYHVWRDVTFRDGDRDIILPAGYDIILSSINDNKFQIFCKGEKIDVSKPNWTSLQSWNHYILPIKDGKKKFRDKKINYILGEENSSDW
jgi:hypothetical protein